MFEKKNNRENFTNPHKRFSSQMKQSAFTSTERRYFTLNLKNKTNRLIQGDSHI